MAMKLEVISDLHLDINEEIPFSRDNKDTFAIVCGDISGNPRQTIQWIKENIKQGIFVEGNHIGYDSEHSVQFIENLLAQTFPVNGNISFFNNNYKIIDDIVFVGGTLWTDFCLDGEAFQFNRMQAVARNLNDYRYSYLNTEHIQEETFDNFEELLKKDLVKQLTTNDTLNMFNNTIKLIKDISEKYQDKKVVVITHHAPSLKSVDICYQNSITNAGFCSNLEKFILEHPNIKLWCHGHIHSSSDYMIGGCRVVCNPRGYEAIHETGTGFNPHFEIEV